MEPNENNLFREVQEPYIASASCSEKRSGSSKSRSRVWEKVVWFTRKAKGTKDSKNSSPEGQKSNNNTSADCGDCKTPGIGKSDCKQKVRKTRSFKYLKRRKVRQFGDDLSSQAVEEEVNLQDCGTATGTFHDFQSERRISRHERTASNNSLLSEIARGMNSSQQKVKENVKSVLSLPLDDLSLNEGPISDSLSPSFPRVRRSVSFSGPAYNSWPRKKRTYLRSSPRVELLSPPMKQKCVSGIRKRASFNGFDSSKIHLKNSYLSLFKGVKSTPHLPQEGHIRNQNGLTIGAIHFYKSPAIYQKGDATLKLFQRKTQPKQTDGESATGAHWLTHKSIGIAEKDGEISTLLSRESDTTTHRIPETTEKHDANVHSNCSLSNEHNCQSNLTCKETIDRVNVSNSCTNNCISFHMKNSDVQNATISAFLLEGECSSSCITTSPVDSSDEDSVKEKPLLSSRAPGDMTPVHSTDENSNITYAVLESKTTCEGGLIRRNSNGSVEAMDIPECYDKAPYFQSNEKTLHSSDSYQESSLSASVSEVVSTDDKIDPAIFSATQCNTQRATALSSCSLPSVDDSEVNKVDVTPSSPCTNGNLQSLRTGKEMIWQGKPIVNGVQFKKHTEVKANC